MRKKEKRRNRERGAGARGRMENKNGGTKKGGRKEQRRRRKEGKSGAIQANGKNETRHVCRNKTSSKCIMPFGGCCARAHSLLPSMPRLQPGHPGNKAPGIKNEEKRAVHGLR